MNLPKLVSFCSLPIANDATNVIEDYHARSLAGVIAEKKKLAK